MLALTAPAARPALTAGRKISTREEWLVAAVEALRPLFARKAGVEVPAVRVSVGFPGGRGAKTSVIGQCWHGSVSKDGVAQVFVSPVLDDSSRVLDVLAHEIVHAINFADGKSGHGAAFSKIAKAIGLTGKMTATVASDDLKAELAAIVNALGEFPHAAMDPTEAARPKQGTRMLRVECPESGYLLRTTAKWLEEFGAPICPCHGVTMRIG